MIVFNSVSIVCIAFSLFLMLKKIDYVFYALCFTAILTTVAVFNIGNDSILLFHIVFAIVVFKFLLSLIKNRYQYSVSNLLIMFVVWCLITIPFSFFNTDVYAYNIDNKFAYVSFNFQQITQYAYLLIGFLTCMICNMLLINGKIDQKTVVKVLDVAYVASLCLALLQLVVPVGICTDLFRNSVHAGYKFDGARISGPFNEPSMLALVCTPFFCGYLYRLINKFSFKYLLYTALFFAVVLNNRSSSAVIGVFVGIILICFVNIFNIKKKIRKKDLVWILIVLIGILLFAVFASNMLGDTIYKTFQKLNGEGKSGSERLYSFVHHMNIFFDHFLLGIGYGTVRSFDLLSTWACEVGIIGLLLYFVPIISLCIKLFKQKNVQSIQLLINIVVYNAILFSSTCEIGFLQIWIIYGVAFYIVQNRKHEKAEKACSELPLKS